MKKFLIPALCGLMAISSCTTSKYMEARNIPINDMEVFAHPVVAKFNIENERKTWQVTIKRKDAIAMGLNVNNMRAYALAIACKDGNPDSKPIYDAIVGATYMVKSSGKRYELEVTGFPAKYAEFRDLKHDDLELLRFSNQGEPEYVPVNVDNAGKFSIFKK